MKQQDLKIGQDIVVDVGTTQPRYLRDKADWCVAEVVAPVAKLDPLRVLVYDRYSYSTRARNVQTGYIVKLKRGSSSHLCKITVDTKGDEPDETTNLRWLPPEKVRECQTLATTAGWLKDELVRRAAQEKHWKEQQAKDKRLAACAKQVAAALTVLGIGGYANGNSRDLAVHIPEEDVPKLLAALHYAHGLRGAAE